MRKVAGAVLAVALMATAAGIWSSLGTAAGLIGAYDPALLESTAAQQVADRFPRDSERLRAFNFIQPPEPIDRGAAARKGDRQQVMAPGCGPSGWPFVAPECLPSAKPARPVERAATVERRTSGNTSALVRTAAAAAAAAPASAATTGAATAAAPPACRQTLAAATTRVERALANVKSLRNRPDACATYRQDFFALVQAREVTALCKTGAERDQDLGRIDLAVEDINGAIAQSCGS
jgi:hypothetical protein